METVKIKNAILFLHQMFCRFEKISINLIAAFRFVRTPLTGNRFGAHVAQLRGFICQEKKGFVVLRA